MGSRGAIQSSSSSQAELQDWLKRLDNGHGSMLKYEAPLLKHMGGDLHRIAKARIQEPQLDAGIVSTIDPAFFAAIACERLGEKIILAKGINQLFTRFTAG